MKIRNSLTDNKEELKTSGAIKIYICGPTVYDVPHIGHLRSAYIFEVIRRYLIYKGYKVTFVRNVTDVDDKIINKAREEYPDKNIDAAFKEVAAKYLKSYHQAMDLFGIMPPDKEPKATEYIEKMKDFIQVLIDKGTAYQSGGDVLFDIKKAKDYGKLSNQSLAAMEAGARVSPGENKKDPLDFALWKVAKEGEPSWPSPWGNGRPGWHIECSVMSSDILGDEFDIHGGGIDLIFPHHENEIAQSEGAGKKFAKIWIHNGLLTINGQKMAKSAGNFVTIEDFIKKYKNMDLLKLFFLGAHYSHPIDYTDEKIEEVRGSLETIMIFLDKAKKETRAAGHRHQKIKEIEEIRHKFDEAMDDDFNTPKALACIFELVNLANKKIKDTGFVCVASAVVKELLLFFGVSAEAAIDQKMVSDLEIKAKIDARDKARENKDYALSDKIRDELYKEGVILEDTKDGTTWRRRL